ncbi:HobA family DNA replication regulator [Sulfurimonas sp. SWIR-19]|uniref:HobA family DNA replication regulator n=1 Tax=Sulfurimonas sp. SWIR-19 TaxID=2878390 RepID=UPI001CF570D2|nr:HobA family DNA replication regulator [Sulfurimonas sp. SWIR-19]UCM99787.1 HobA family DNA replication regulator [Sulfurimonas sp. SWIR-19]
MPDFAQWSLDAIREKGGSLSWLEEHRFEWSKTTAYALEQILNGKTIILITDEKRKWFENYILSSLNGVLLERPMIPVISIDNIYTYYNSVGSGEMIDIIDDMISLSFKGDYFFWYIGKGDDKRSDIAKRKDESYFWIFDEDFNNAFTLKSYDTDLDIKLLQLYKLFDASLNAAMFGEVDASS